VAQVASKVTVEYDASQKTLTLTATGSRGTYRETMPSDLSVGSLKSGVSFPLPFAESLPDGRTVGGGISCGAL